MFKNICFIGLPYSGKSYIGNKLFRIMNKGFIDTDNIIKSVYNKDLKDIINKYGNEHFLDIEESAVKSVIADNIILSTGGSVVYRQNSINHIKNNLNSDIIYLYITYPEFKKRITNFNNRGIIIGPDQSLKHFYDERCSLYEKYSDYRIDFNS